MILEGNNFMIGRKDFLSKLKNVKYSVYRHTENIYNSLL